MQCPLSSCCFSAVKLVFLAIGGLGLAVGVLSVVWPKRSIGLYQWIMERLNWKVAPIDEAHELRSTRILGTVLSILSLTIFYMLFYRR